MNRIDRLHAIVVHLQSKKKVTAQEMADRFGLSLRTVYRDIKALDEAGVPVIGEAGSGYTIMEGYRLPPLMFNREEASALLLAAKFSQNWSNENDQRHFESAVYKIKAVLRTSDKDYVDELSAGISVAPSRLPIEETGGQHLYTLQHALAHKKVVQMQYHSIYENNTTTRRVEPIGICYYGTCWHLIAWCQLRNDYRDFRVSRIQSLTVEEESFKNAQRLSLNEYLQQLLAQQSLQEATIDVDKSIARLLRETKYFYGFVSEEEFEEVIRMKFMVASLESLGRWLLSFTDAVTIVAPAVLHEMMCGYVRELAIKFSHPLK